MHVLLTGAGFTKNWDGRLAGEFQTALLGDRRVRERERVLKLVADQPSFEVAYGIAHGPPYDDDDRAALEAGIRGVFYRMDQDHSNIDRMNRINNYGACELISRFGRRTDQAGYFFTLNQDCLVERIFNPHPITAANLQLPGVATRSGERTFGVWNWPIPPKTVRFDPAAPPSLDRQFNYIKLHGSAEWVAPGGRSQMVIGTGKESQIAGNVLLAWYLGVFEQVLMATDVRLMTIGYGYGDDHINRIIAAACRNNGLRLFAWNAHSKPLEIVRSALGSDIIPIVADTPLKDLLPSDQSRPAELDRIVKTFFDT